MKLHVIVWFVAFGFLVSSSAAQNCPVFAPAQQVGTVAAPALTEASGLAASRKNAGVFWTHNDSPDIVRIFAIDKQGTQLADFILSGALQQDWEDIAVGPGPSAGVDCVYVGDIGDNITNPVRRTSITVYRIDEPTVDAQTTTGTATLSGVAAISLTYPDGPHDAETLMSDPRTGDLYIVEKATSVNAGLFRKPAPHAAGSSVLERVATISPGLLSTGGDISPSGDAILIRGYTTVKFWERPATGNLWDAFLAPACPGPVASEPQGEAICFSADDCGYYTLSEGAAQPIYYYKRAAYCAVAPSQWRMLD